MRGTRLVNTRKEKRKPVTLKIKFKSATLGQFIERYSVDVSHGGIFIRTKDPLQVGTQMRFEFQLQDASPLISGEGTVVWTREHDPTRTGVSPGMGVRFDKLGGASKGVLQKILVQKAKGGSPQFDQNNTSAETRSVPPRAPGVRKPRSATNLPLKPGGAGLGLAPRTGGFDTEPSSARGGTPLPKPMPFHSTVDDDFSNEVFDQPTRVAAIDEIMADSKAKADPAVGAAAKADAAAKARADAAAKAQADAAAKAKAIPRPGATPSRPLVKPPPMKPAARPPPNPPVAAKTSAPPKPAVEIGAPSPPSRPMPPARPAATPVAPPESLERPGTAVIGKSYGAAGKRSAAVPILLSLCIVVVVAAGVYVVIQKQKAAAFAGGTTPTEVDGNPVANIAPPPPIDAELETGIVVAIASEPEGATVLIDGTEVGTTPYRLSGLQDGDKHKVEIVKACYKPMETKLVAAEGASINANLRPYIRTLRVSSEPANATLLVDGKRKGHTPRDVRLVGSLKPEDPHVVRVTKPRHEAAETKVLPDAPCKTEGRIGVVEVSMRLVPKETDEPTRERTRSRTRRPRDRSDDPPKDRESVDPPKDDPEPVKEPVKDDPEPVEDPPKDDSPVKDDNEDEHTPDWMKDG